MSITIGANITSLRTVRKLGDATDALSRSFERLSSGQRINRASDDAAGLAISTQLNSRALVFKQAIRNINDGISIANIAEGALGALRDISIRQLELAEQAANGTYSYKQRDALNVEANALVDEFNRITGSTTFNGRRILDPSQGSIAIQVGYGSTGGVLQLDINASARTTGDGTFQAAVSFQAAGGASPRAVTYGDLNGDGRTDLVTVDDDYDKISIFIGNGDGTFQAPRSIQTGSFSYSIATVDLNGDGRLDLTTTDDSGYIRIFLGNGNGSFLASTNLYNGTSDPSFAQAYGDFNGDGRIDLVSTASASPNSFVAVRLGNGDGTFQAQTAFTLAGGDSRSVSLGDFNRDGYLDLVTADSNDNNVSILLGTGTGSFQAAVSYQVGGLNPRSVSVGDFNGDNLLDLITADYGSDSVSLLLGNGNGSFRAATTVAISGTEPVSVFSSDLNGDGYLDFVTADRYGDNASVFIGNGNGTFRTPVSLHTAGSGPNSVSVGDFNGDGALDIVTADYNNSAGNNISVFFANAISTATMPEIDLTTQSGARSALTSVTANLNRVVSQLGVIGAATSRFYSALATLQVQSENSLAAAGRIQSADIAAESAELARRRIQQQAAASVLAQANLQPALALQLLGP